MGTYLVCMLVGYTLTVLIETVVLLLALSRRHPMKARLFAGVWLTACTYPIVWLVLPGLFEERQRYLIVAELFAPVAECALFWLAFIRTQEPCKRATIRDFAAIIVANLASFGLGEVFISAGGYEAIVGEHYKSMR